MAVKIEIGRSIDPDNKFSLDMENIRLGKRFILTDKPGRGERFLTTTVPTYDNKKYFFYTSPKESLVAFQQLPDKQKPIILVELNKDVEGVTILNGDSSLIVSHKSQLTSHDIMNSTFIEPRIKRSPFPIFLLEDLTGVLADTGLKGFRRMRKELGPKIKRLTRPARRARRKKPPADSISL